MRVKYERFINEGTLIIMNGKVLDMNEVYEDLERHIEDKQYDVCALRKFRRVHGLNQFL